MKTDFRDFFLSVEIIVKILGGIQFLKIKNILARAILLLLEGTDFLASGNQL